MEDRRGEGGYARGEMQLGRWREGWRERGGGTRLLTGGLFGFLGGW